MAVGNWQHWPGGAAPPPPPSNEIPWTPRLILGDVTGWWASDDVTHAADTETVHKIFDRAQYGYDLVPKGTTAYRESAQNSLGTVAVGPSGDPQGALWFDAPLVVGKGDYLVTANVFRVYDETNAANRKEYMRLARGGTTNTDYFRYALDFDGTSGSSLGDFHVRWRSEDNVSASYSENIGNANIDFTRHQIHFSIIDLGAGTVVHRIDGTEVLNTTFVPTTPSNPGTDSSNLIYGANQPAGFYLRADFAEALWLNRVPTAGEIDLIEGYLAHKWGLQAHLPTAHPYKSSAPTILTPFLPSDVSGLAAWWDPTTLTSQAVGTEVTSLPDLGPRDLDLVPDTRSGSTGPVLSTTSGPNNRRYLDYASLDTLWKNAPEEYFYRNCAGGTVFIVSRNDTLDGQFHYIYLIGTESGSSINNNQRAAFLKWNTGDATALGGRVPDNASAQWVVGPNPMSTSWALNCQRYDYVNTTAENFLNGALEFSTTSFQTSTRTTDLGPQYFTLGYRINDNTSPHLWFEGGIAEVVIYDRTLSDDEREKIEGYLAHKYGLTLPAAHPYFSEPFGGSLLWDPSRLSTLEAWYDANAITGVSNGSDIGTWSDSSGNGYTGTSFGGAIYTTNAQNGLPAIVYDGTGNARIYVSNTDMVSGASDMWMYMVGDTDPSLTPQPVTISGTTTSATLVAFHFRSNNTLWFRYNVSALANTGAAGYATSGWKVTGMRTESSTLYGYQDGASLSLSNPAISNPLPTQTAAALMLGERSGGVSDTIGEVLIGVGVLSDSDREKIDGYLAHKWGLTANLPASHPYKDSPPTN